MTWYRIDTHSLEPAMSITLFRWLLRWAAQRGDRFELICQTRFYDAHQLEQLRGLGETGGQIGPGDLVTRLFSRLFDRDTIVIRGVPGDGFVREMTSHAAPERVIVGHESPVESIVIFRNEQPFYASYDYGTVQTLDLSEEDRLAITSHLADWKLGPDLLLTIPEAPPA